MTKDELIKLAIEKGNTDIVEKVIEYINEKDKQYLKQREEFYEDVANVTNNINSLVADMKADDGFQYASLNNITDTVKAALVGTGISYHVETCVDTFENGTNITAKLVVSDKNGYSEKWNSIQLPVTIKGNEELSQAIQRVSNYARKISIINGFNLSINKSINIDTEIKTQTNNEIVFPDDNADTMEEAELENGRATAEDNIKVLAEKKELTFQDVFRRICNQLKLNAAERSTFTLEQWGKINETTLSYLRNVA